MKILFFTKGGVTVASSNERVWIVADYLRKHYGYEYDIVSARESGIKDAFAKLFKNSYDVLVVHKSLFSFKVVALLVLAKLLLRKRFIYDLDDAQWLHSPKKSALFARLADTVFAGSHYIMEWAEHFNSSVVHIPTLVDHKRFAQYKVSHKNKHRYTIGWIGGGPEHFRRGNFSIIRPALEKLGKRGCCFRFYIIGTRGHKPLEAYIQSPFYEINIVPFIPYADVPKYIRDFDIGVMPLQDDPFERAKCAAKAIQYMAVGVPPVVSPVGENVFVVENGKDGFLASSTDEWVNIFEMLLEDTALRNKIGKAGMEKVKNNYSHKTVLKRYATIVASLMQK
ncbi:MAG: hypothetical protein A3F85_02080 [Candidatus Ryanbacteria bacterium RIFCSPLOWO2_12_FULL_44_26]|nr:MAG: hypothetical protein A2718_01840 [Candidatus Ryanbacteria bacterium RIFCSPHIGHO2_01_FULL_44_130]OGZ54934.1 MAG: hypothetical protein A3F85_02080 [Candidatus Ryanbacteria bacterium RIFCSPLOWO2_12_FULL_44_26]